MNELASVIPLKRAVGPAVDPRSMQAQLDLPPTFETLAWEWLDGQVELRPKTRSSYASLLRQWLVPALGNQRVGSITKLHLEAVLAAWDHRSAAGGSAPRTARRAGTLLRQIGREVLGLEIDASRLAPDVDSAGWDRLGRVFSASEIFRLLISRSSSDRRAVGHYCDKVLLALGALAGLRWGEAVALRWTDWIESHSPLSALHVARAHPAAGELGRTKTGIVRWVPVHRSLAAVLGTWRHVEELELGRPVVPSDRILVRFADRTALPIGHSATSERWAAWLRREGLPHRSIHDLRATFATLCGAGGADPWTIERITHAAPRAGGRVLQGYLRLHWPTLCKVVEAIELPRQIELGFGAPRIEVLR